MPRFLANAAPGFIAGAFATVCVGDRLGLLVGILVFIGITSFVDYLDKD